MCLNLENSTSQSMIFCNFEVLVSVCWGRVTHICVRKLIIIGSDNGLSPGQHQAIIWNNAGMMLIVPLGTNFSEILIEIITISFKKMRLKVSSAKWRPFCLGLNVSTMALYQHRKPIITMGCLFFIMGIFILQQTSFKLRLGLGRSDIA